MIYGIDVTQLSSASYQDLFKYVIHAIRAYVVSDKTRDM